MTRKEYKKIKKDMWIKFYKKWSRRHFFMWLIFGCLGGICVSYDMWWAGLNAFFIGMHWFGLAILGEFLEAKDNIWGD